MKSILKRSGFIVGCVRAIRAAVLDFKRVYWLAIRGPKIKKYLHEHSVRKLQIGTSGSPLAGWLNTDFKPERPEVVYLDATQPFPFDDDTFDYVTCEHMIEHIDHEAAVAMLRESFRVLKPGGKMRISTPDLQVFSRLCEPQKTAEQAHFVDWIIRRDMPQVADCRAVFVVNQVFRAWGHQFLYDLETLKTTMSHQGFVDLKRYKAGESDDCNLRGIEAHGRVTRNEEINQFQTLVVEGLVPDSKKPA